MMVKVIVVSFIATLVAGMPIAFVLGVTARWLCSSGEGFPW